MSPAWGRGDRVIPDHPHGSVYYYNLGCAHPDCTAAGTEAKRKARAALHSRRRPARFAIEGNAQVRMYHPDLFPANSNMPNRHGTVLGRKEYRCDCPACASIHSTNRRLED